MKLNRLFLDVEWADDKDKTILQIGAFLYNEDYKLITEFYSVVCPEHIEKMSRISLELMNLSCEDLEKSDPIENVLKKFDARIKDYDEIIIWTDQAYQILSEKMNTFGFQFKKHRKVILQEVLKEIYRKLRFSKALKQFGIKHKDERLHNAKYDALYLKALYWAIQKEYSEYHRWKSNITYYYSLRSDIIHSENCLYVKRMTSDNRRNTNPIKIFDGFKMCKCCKNDFRFKREKAVSQKILNNSFRDESIYEMCNYLGLRCTISDNVIFIKTDFSSWRIYHNHEEVTHVYHENFRKNMSSESQKKIKHGYHEQNIKSCSLYATLKYIRKHDKKCLIRKNKYQQRMYYLFKLAAGTN